MRIRQLNQAGDTIVEVLFAIAIISFVLAGAYVLASHNTENERQSDERTQALQIAQSQVEAIQDMTLLSAPYTLSLSSLTGSNFCLEQSAGPAPFAVTPDHPAPSTNCNFNSADVIEGVIAPPDYVVDDTIATTPGDVGLNPVTSQLQYLLTVSVNWQPFASKLNSVNETITYNLDQ